MITLTEARLDTDEIEQLDAVCRSQEDYWRLSGDQDPAAMTRDSIEAMLRADAEAEDCGYRRIDLRPDRAKSRPAIVMEKAFGA